MSKSREFAEGWWVLGLAAVVMVALVWLDRRWVSECKARKCPAGSAPAYIQGVCLCAVKPEEP